MDLLKSGPELPDLDGEKMEVRGKDLALFLLDLPEARLVLGCLVHLGLLHVLPESAKSTFLPATALSKREREREKESEPSSMRPVKSLQG